MFAVINQYKLWNWARMSQSFLTGMKNMLFLLSFFGNLSEKPARKITVGCLRFWPCKILLGKSVDVDAEEFG